VHEILDNLPPRARVLDLGAQAGSFSLDQYPHLTVVRADLSQPNRHDNCSVLADAAQLPFPSRAFDAVILNHSLEHFARLKPALQEIGRVVTRDGAVYVAVPDARTITDRLYRKLYAGSGGHLNLFDSEAALTKMLAWYLGLEPGGARALCSSFAFLNRRNARQSVALRQTRFAGLPEPLLARLSAAFRLFDRRFHTRASRYGWALYFGKVGASVDPAVRTNVCIRCGAGHAAGWLLELGLVRRRAVFKRYQCPQCGAANYYTPDEPPPAAKRP
jgi:SAM-dependent methyltransferase